MTPTYQTVYLYSLADLGHQRAIRDTNTGSKSKFRKEIAEVMQGTNSGGDIGYMGPCPPSGKPHRYFPSRYNGYMRLKLNQGRTRKTLRQRLMPFT